MIFMTSDEIGLDPGEKKKRGLVAFTIEPDNIELSMEGKPPVLKTNNEKIIVRDRRNNRKRKNSDLF